MTTKTNNSIEALEWRYATKKFDNTRKVSEDDLHHLLEAIRLAPSSFGLQPFQVIVIENTELREKLTPAAYNQTQISDASHLIVFAAKTSITEEYVDSYINNIAQTRGIEKDQVKGFGDYIVSNVSNLSSEQILEWNKKQTYIALGILAQTAAELRIDMTPMEGFSAAQFDEILGLTEKGLTTSLIAPIGYRSNEDGAQHFPKVRRSKSDMLTHI